MAFLETTNLESEIDIFEQQQHFYELFGHSSSIIYDVYTTKESLSKKINLILPHKSIIDHHELTAAIWHQNQYNGGNCLYMSLIYVTLVLDEDHKASPGIEISSTLLSKKFQVHPVFRVQKCLTKSADNSNCCAVFIDESGRVYKNWNAFRMDNLYDDGLVVAPLNGIYNGRPDDSVKLELFERRAGITRSLDHTSMVVGLASAGITVMTLIPAMTIAPVVAVGAAAAGLSCAVYSGIRGIYNLYDRKKHKQTIKITNPDARSSWINFAAGAFSVSAAGATQILANTAHNSRGVTNIVRSTAHALNAGAFGLHTTGCLDDIYIVLSKMRRLDLMTPMEISHLSSILYLLTHSMKNCRTAKKILILSEGCELHDVKKILRQRQKLAMNGLVHETMNIQGRHNDANKSGQITVRSLKSEIDSRPLLMEFDDDGDEEIAKRNVKENMIKGEYLKMFESQVSAFIERILSKNKTRAENELKLLVINLMKEVSIHLFDDFVSLIESMIDKYGAMAESRSHNVITFEHFAVLILKQLKVISKDSNVDDLKEYLIELTETERGKIDDRIREYFEHLEEEHIHNANELLASHIDLSDDEKIEIAIDSEVDRFVHKCLHLNIVYMKDDLRETVKDVLYSMPLKAASTFFHIVTEFKVHFGTDVQSRLGRFIPIDIFMTDIHMLLKKISVSFGQELEQYLLEGEDIFLDVKERVFEFYDSQLAAGDSSKCHHCEGFYYNSTHK